MALGARRQIEAHISATVLTQQSAEVHLSRCSVLELVPLTTNRISSFVEATSVRPVGQEPDIGLA